MLGLSKSRSFSQERSNPSGHGQRRGSEARVSHHSSVASGRERSTPAARKQSVTTMVDLFLAGGEGEVNEAVVDRKLRYQDLRVQWIVGPNESEEFGLDLDDEHQPSHEEGNSKGSGKGLTPEEIAEKRERRRRELMVQEYWKSFAAEALAWPHLGEAVEDCQRFEKHFREFAYGFDEKGHARNLHFKQSWVVMSLHKVGVRSAPTLDPAAVTDRALPPGSCVIIDTVVQLDGVLFAKLANGGWVFDNAGETHAMSRMDDVEVGLWWYQLVGKTLVETRRVPSFAHEARTGFVMSPNEVVVVCCRCRIDGKQFLRLSDGRGWVFAEKPHDVVEAEEGDTRLFVPCAGHQDRTVAHGKGAGRLRGELNIVGVEHGLWKYEILDKPVLRLGMAIYGSTLEPGTIFLCDMRVPASGHKAKEVSVKGANNILTRIWLRLEDGSGWVPKTDMDNKPLVRFVGLQSKKKAMAEPDHRPVPPPTEVHSQDWRAGIA